VVGEALAVVAGRRRDHAPGALLGGQLQQLVQRAALLVGGGELQVLELDPDLGAGDLRQGPRMVAGRAFDLPLDPFGGGFDLGEREGHGGSELRAAKAAFGSGAT